MGSEMLNHMILSLFKPKRGLIVDMRFVCCMKLFVSLKVKVPAFVDTYSLQKWWLQVVIIRCHRFCAIFHGHCFLFYWAYSDTSAISFYMCTVVTKDKGGCVARVWGWGQVSYSVKIAAVVWLCTKNVLGKWTLCLRLQKSWWQCVDSVTLHFLTCWSR